MVPGVKGRVWFLSTGLKNGNPVVRVPGHLHGEQTMEKILFGERL